MRNVKETIHAYSPTERKYGSLETNSKRVPRKYSLERRQLSEK